MVPINLLRNLIVFSSRNHKNCSRHISALSVRNETKDHNASTSNDLDLIKTSQDLSEITPYYPQSFNLAAYVNNSEFLQNLVHLNVNLAKLEKKPQIVEKILKLNVDKIRNHILLLNDYVNKDELGSYITKNPMIFYESLNDLDVRINYLKSKKFTDLQIQRIISLNPFWLMFSTLRIDRRLGYYQQKYNLLGEDVRYLASKLPKLITYNLHHVSTNTFVMKEEMGFQDSELKQLILAKPKLFMINQKSLLERFNYLHNIMNVPHSTILLHPEVLLCRNFKVKQRHLFLQQLGRDQFNPKKENYVPIKALAEGSDADFCRLYAKCDISDFNTFLKTL